jgi:hypothetical protein
MRVVDVVHPGPVRSQEDGEMHWVGFVRLAVLHGLDPSSGSVLDASLSGTQRMIERLNRHDEVEVRHWFPQADGQYGFAADAAK